MECQLSDILLTRRACDSSTLFSTEAATVNILFSRRLYSRTAETSHIFFNYHVRLCAIIKVKLIRIRVQYSETLASQSGDTRSGKRL